MRLGFKVRIGDRELVYLRPVDDVQDEEAKPIGYVGIQHGIPTRPGVLRVSDDVVLATSDAHVARYSRGFETLKIELVLWDERSRIIRAEGVGDLHDVGTWERDGLVRHPALDSGDRLGYAVVDTDDVATLCFNATKIVL